MGINIKKIEVRFSQVKGSTVFTQEFSLGRFLTVSVSYDFKIVLTSRPLHFISSFNILLF